MPERLPLTDGHVDLATGRAEVAGRSATLTPRERAVLQLLAARAGQLVDREAILAGAWADHPPSPRSVDRVVRQLRTKIEPDPDAPVHLLTVHGEGYRFVPTEAPAAVLELGDATFDLAPRRWRDARGDRILTPKEASLLEVLAEADGQPVDRETLQQRVWGTRRRAALRYVDYVVHGLRKKIEPDPAEPTRLRAVPGVGYYLERGGTPPVSPAPRSNLGAETTSFVGRAAERSRVRDALQTHRLVTLAGPGGAGKTRLARHVAQEHLEAGEVWFCDLSACEHGDQVHGVVVRTAGLDGAQGPALGRALDARGRVLLILDNAEHVVDAVAGWAEQWLADTRALRLLVTSRQRLELVDELVVELGPLGPDDAVALYLDRARQVRAAPDPPADAVARLCVRLDGLPLAIELAAARATVLDPEGMVDQLDQRFRVLRRGRGGRQGSLWATIAWSWQLLGPAQQAAFAQLSVFRGGFDLDAAEAVIDGPDVLDRVDALVRHSLVVAGSGSGGLRFSLYESLRAFAAAQLEAHGGTEPAHDRHAHHFAARARRLRRRADEGGELAAERSLAAERDNLWGAAQHLAVRDPAAAAACLRALAYDARVRGEDADDASTRLLDRVVDRLDPPTAAGLRLDRAERWLRIGRRPEALSDLRAALADPELVGAPRAEVGLATANLLQRLGHFDESEGAVAEAVSAGSDAPTFAARVDRQRGVIARGRADLEDAWAHHQASLARLQALGHVRGVAAQRFNLAMVRISQGRAGEVVEDLGALVDQYEQLGSRFHVAGTLNLLGAAHLELGDLDAAERALRRAADLAARCGAAHVEALVAVNLSVLLGDREPGTSLQLRRRALDLHRELGNPRGELVALLNVAMSAVTCGLETEAREAIDATVALAQRLDSPAREAKGHVLSALHHGLWGETMPMQRALEHAARALERGADAETRALLEAVGHLTALPAARVGDREARARLETWLATPWEAERFGQVQWARERALAALEAQPST